MAELRERLGINAARPPGRPHAYQQRLWADLERACDAALQEPTTELAAARDNWESQAWGGNLGRARRAQEIILWCAFAHLLTQRREYAARARDEMDAVLAWPSWVDPVHLPLEADLMTGEVCFGLAVGYDWLYDELSVQEREQIRTGLVEKGLRPYLTAAKEGAPWARCTHHWNAVVNGGCAVAAMALLGEWPGAEECLARARENIGVFFDAIPVDGGCSEGVSYWRDGMHYAMCFAAARRTVLGSDDEIILRDGVRNTAYFPIYFTAPDGRPANFGDCCSTPPDTPIFHYLSMRTGRREFGRHRRRVRARAHPFDLLWGESDRAGRARPELPLSACFRDTGWAALRSSWNDADALYVAIKSGDLPANHSHLDLNSFILVANGDRFVIDPGPPSYSKEYFGPRRWEHYETSTRAHNTIVIDGRNQDAQAAGRISDFFSSPQYASVTADASAAYAPRARLVRRHFVMIGGNTEAQGEYVVLLDELRLAESATVEWLLHTLFPVEVRDGEARLRGEHGDLCVTVLLPEDAGLELREEPDRHLALNIPPSARRLWILAVLQPVAKGDRAPRLACHPCVLRAKDAPADKQPAARSELISPASHCGLELHRDGALDRLLLRTAEEGEVEGGGIYFDGQKAFARTTADGALVSAVLENGTALAVDSDFLLGAERPVSAAVDLSQRACRGIVRARCWAAERTGLSFSVWGYPEGVRVNGSEVDIDAVGGMVSVVLERPGDHDVQVLLGAGS